MRIYQRYYQRYYQRLMKKYCLHIIVLAASLSFINSAAADVKVAFIGDQSTSKKSLRVLQLIADEQVDLLLIQGDLGYRRNASIKWESYLNRTLGPNFPVLAVVGNHENFEWNNYQRLLKERIDRIPELSCDGDVGVKALCQFGGLSIVQVAAGVSEVEGVKPQDEYPSYILDNFNNNPAKWRICSWHKNQNAMQIGGKTDETGWGVYEACLNSGAMVATGHEHSYSRTHLLSSFENQTIVHKNSHMELDIGQSFAFVNGLGGKGIRKQKTDGDWWAAKYSRSQRAKYGALFCTFRESTAECYFKTIAGFFSSKKDIPDRFTLESLVGVSQPR